MTNGDVALDGEGAEREGRDVDPEVLGVHEGRAANASPDPSR